MNEIKIEDINNVYDLLQKAENKGNEIIVRLLDSKAVIYYSDNLDIFNIDIIKKMINMVYILDIIVYLV